MRPVFNKDLFTFKTGLKTRFYEVDLQGVIHHSVMIKYFEIGRVEYWRELGISYQDFLDSGLQYVVARVECSYIKPLSFDMEITIMVRSSRISKTSITYEYLIYNDKNECAVHGITVLVCLKTGKNKPYPLPKPYLDKVISFEIDDSIDNKAYKH
jgi:acyl-CoA thioester hydrolase